MNDLLPLVTRERNRKWGRGEGGEGEVSSKADHRAVYSFIVSRNQENRTQAEEASNCPALGPTSFPDGLLWNLP